MITNYRTITKGLGIDGYTEVQLLKDGAWVSGRTFEQSDDFMLTNMSQYISAIKAKMQDARTKFYRCEVRPTAFRRDRSTVVDFGTSFDDAKAYAVANGDFHIVTYYKESI